MRNAAGLLLACVIGATFVQFHQRTHLNPHTAWDDFTLPGFDAHVYVAMAEEPRVFTVAPWGYRVLPAGLIGAIVPPPLIVPAFDWMARGSLIAASGLLFIYLRIRGATLRATLIAVALAMATPSVGAVFGNPFLVEPFALVLLLVALIAIEGGASSWVVALTLVALSLSKEIWVLLLPVIFLREGHEGARVAARRTLGMAGPAIWVSLFLRLMWLPQAGSEGPGTDFMATLGSVGSSVARFAPEFLLAGLSILALLALVRAGARDYLLRHVFTIPPLLALPVIAAAAAGEGAAGLLTDHVRRLLIYMLPFAAALAAYLDPAHENDMKELPDSTPVQRAAMALTFLSMLAPLGLDRYSRIDLSTTRDGPYVLGFARETLETARKLDRGETVVLNPEERKFVPGVSPPDELAKLRFFLRRGFGPVPYYGQGEIRMQEARATLIVPILDRRGLRLTLTVDAKESAWVEVLAEGTRIGEVLVGPQAVDATFEIPAGSLRRGDNPIELRREKGSTALPRLLRLELRQPLGSR